MSRTTRSRQSVVVVAAAVLLVAIFASSGNESSPRLSDPDQTQVPVDPGWGADGHTV